MQTIQHTNLICVLLNAIVITFALLIAYRIVVVLCTIKVSKRKKNVWCILLYCACAIAISISMLLNDKLALIHNFNKLCHFMQTYAALYLCYKSLQKTLAVLTPTSKIGKVSKSKLTNYESTN